MEKLKCIKKKDNKPFCKKQKCFIDFKECANCKEKEYKPVKIYKMKQSTKPMKNRSSKISKACDIPKSVRDIVEARDKGMCVICKVNKGLPNMHYIPRSKLGLGIPENVVCGCLKCHHEYDNGSMREHHGEIIKMYLQSKYKDWSEDMLTYHKY